MAEPPCLIYENHLQSVLDVYKRQVHSWINTLLPDEAEIIQKRIIDKKAFDFIAIQLGYANHSSVIRKYKNILNKLSLQEIHKC